MFYKKKEKKGDIEFDEYDLLDGQQRLTTLFLIAAVIRDICSEDEKLTNTCHKAIYQDENKYTNTPERMRIVFDIRQEVKEFINKNVKEKGKTILPSISDCCNNRDKSIKNMAIAITTIHDFFKEFSNKELPAYFKYLQNNTIIICTASENLDDAFRLFTVLNNRGLKLRSSDILKAENLQCVDASKREQYAKKWEEIETYFEDEFDSFLSHIRMILVRKKARNSLLEEFERNIYKSKNSNEETPLLKKGEDTFKTIEFHYESYEKLFDRNNNASSETIEFDNLIKMMSDVLPADYWKAALLSYFEKHNKNQIITFLKLLDNKFSADWIVGLTPTYRIESINKILKKIEETTNTEELLSNDCFSIEIENLVHVLKGEDVYGKRYDKYLLYKLNFLYQGNTTRLEPLNRISVEHILPQNPHANSQWCKDFNDDDKKEWTNKIGNLILISRRKNAALGRKDYIEKREKYFLKNVELFSNSVRIMSIYPAWTLKHLITNNTEVIEKLSDHYKLNPVAN